VGTERRPTLQRAAVEAYLADAAAGLADRQAAALSYDELTAAERQLEQELSDLPTVQALRAHAQASAVARLAALTGAEHREHRRNSAGSPHAATGGGGGGSTSTPEMIQRLRAAADRGSPLLDEETEVRCSRGDGKRLLGDAKSSLRVATSSLGDAQSLLG
jgi:hypothetical protein